MQSLMEGLNVYLNEKYRPKTVALYFYEIENYLSNHPNASEYKQSEVLKYIGELRNRGLQPVTVNRKLASIKAFYKYLVQSGKRKDNPVRYLYLKDKIKRDIQLQDLLDEGELELLLERKERYPLLKHRNFIIISLLIYQGLRIKELDKIMLNDIDIKKGKIKIRKQAKTNGRDLYLREEQIEALVKYMEEDRPKLLNNTKSQYLLIGQRGYHLTGEDITKHIIFNYRNYVPEKKINPQIIRQSVITNLLKKGKDLRLVQVFAGHRYPDTTERYKQNNVDELQREIEKYHPLK